MDLFYTDADGLILEHWDTIAAYVADTKSGEDMIRGTAESDSSANTQANKNVVLEFTKQVLQERGFDRLEQFMSDDVIQRAAPIGKGLAGMADWLASDEFGFYEFLFQLVCQGDHVVTYSKRFAGGKEITVFNVFNVFNVYRVADGKIVEHWMNEEEISPREAWGNSGKF
jgi:predicted SnoaL-like aldol condensation-catalyzing enzyme